MKIYNRKFQNNYQEIEKYQVGIVLTGPEVKSIKLGRLKLDDAYVKILGGEAYLINAQIPLYQYTQDKDYNPNRSRKLLLNKKEIIRLETKLKSAVGLTIIPISCYNKGSLIKLEIALAKGRKDIEKRKLEKYKEIKRGQEKELKEWMRK